MRSDAIDQLVTSYLERPVRVSWEGDLGDPLKGSVEAPEIVLGGIATAWLPLEKVVIGARRASIAPGLPASISLEAPSVSIAIGQYDVDQWLEASPLPFRLRLEENGLMVQMRIKGLPIGEFETRLGVKGGWFVLEPKRTASIGLPSWVGVLLRTYLPVPPISDSARIESVRHEEGRLWIDFGSDDLEEVLTPGLFDRLRKRIMPMAR